MISPFRRTQAVALLLVLGALVLISVLVLAFLQSTSTELKSSKLNADEGSVRQLAQSVISLVTGQIRAGTRSRDSSNNPVAWASQPGMIRTYDTSGQAAGYYKLYSSRVMTGTGAFDPAATTEAVPDTWNNNPAVYTDLNEPVSGRFPIVDPAAGAVDPNDQRPTPGPRVEGFIVTQIAAVTADTANHPLPMPVQWLYMLADGTLVAPTAASAGKKAVVPTATVANPIVSRVAFWTDDETCKINVNTASEGTFWDLPRVNSTADVQLSLDQPALNEFQRYAGHPATTSLSPVLGWKLPVTPASNGFPPYAQVSPYYLLTPRINGGGSKAGTVDTTNVQKVTLDTDHLYASVDELQFVPDRTPRTVLTANDLDTVRFFLTAQSRAPDLNLFNRPRVVVWPISSTDNANTRTVWDQAIAFCGTVGNNRYYFQRQNSNDPTSDLQLGDNQKLLTYLRDLTARPIPGFGGTFVAKYPQDRNQILTEIFDYIRCTNLCDNNGNESGAFASFTSRAASTAGSGKGQVVPIYDAATDTRGFGRFPTLSEAAFVFIDGKDDAAASVPATKVQMKAALVLELFDPAMGFPVNLGRFQIKVSGLSGLKWPDGSTMFDGPGTNLVFQHKAVSASDVPIAHTRDFGGNDGFRFYLAQNTTNTFFSIEPSTTAYPINTTFAFPGAAVTVEFQTVPEGVTVQTITLKFPAATIPVPREKVGSVTLSGTNATTNLRSFDPTSGRFSSKNVNGDGAWISQFDTVRSVSARDGDYRLIAGKRTINDTGLVDDLFTPLRDTDAPKAGNSNPVVSASYFDPTVALSHTLREAVGDPFNGAYRGFLVKNAPYWRATVPSYTSNPFNNPATDANLLASGTGGGLASQCGDQDLRYNGVAVGTHASFVAGTDTPGDWDNGFGDVQDGPYINKPDEGVAAKTATSTGPYFYPTNQNPVVDAAGTLFSPNRQIPSAVMFGSLPTGVKANRPWQTLLFRPDPSGKHPGGKNRAGDGTALPNAPADHLLLDLFQMPVVEPYPISEPLSTAGRINMNYQIVPFTYIKRDSGIRAVLKSERLLAIDNIGTNQNVNRGTTAVDYKQNGNTGGVPTVSTTDWRKDINVTETLTGFTQRFATGEIFRSATEICEIPLVPANVGATYAAVSSATTDYWYTKFPLSGDNSREKPYADIYPRLTTKSNTFTVHYRVQTLQKPRSRLSSTPTEFDTGAGDTVAAEFRGSTTIEKYVDPNDATLPDFAGGSVSDASKDIDSHYRFRVIASKQFTP